MHKVTLLSLSLCCLPTHTYTYQNWKMFELINKVTAPIAVGAGCGIIAKQLPKTMKLRDVKIIDLIVALVGVYNLVHTINYTSITYENMLPSISFVSAYLIARNN